MEEMISVATEFAEKGDGGAMGRLGRAYRDGKGVPQDMNKAAEWMRKAADKNIRWAKNELFDIPPNIAGIKYYSSDRISSKKFKRLAGWISLFIHHAPKYYNNNPSLTLTTDN